MPEPIEPTPEGYAQIGEWARTKIPMAETAELWSRLRSWAHEAHGWDGRIGIKSEMRNAVSATIGPITGYGQTTNEAINNLADGLIEEGWPDDREEQK